MLNITKPLPRIPDLGENFIHQFNYNSVPWYYIQGWVYAIYEDKRILICPMEEEVVEAHNANLLLGISDEQYNRTLTPENSRD